MALVKCRECQKEISSEAKTCPHCGAAKKKKPGFLRNTLYGIVIVIGVLFIIGTMSDPKERASTSASANASTPSAPAVPAFAFETTPAQLAAAYDENTVAADNQYKGKRYKVTGAVDSINTGIGGGIYITMKGGNPFLQPQFALEDSEKNAAAALKKGQKATLICTGAGDIAKTPMSRKCVFS